MNGIDDKRRVPAPGGASPRGHLLLRVEGSHSREFRDHAGRVLSRRNKRDLKVLGEVSFQPGTRPPTTALLRRVGHRQGLQLALLEGGAR